MRAARLIATSCRGKGCAELLVATYWFEKEGRCVTSKFSAAA